MLLCITHAVTVTSQPGSQNSTSLATIRIEYEDTSESNDPSTQKFTFDFKDENVDRFMKTIIETNGDKELQR